VGRGVSKAGLCAHNGPNDGPHIILLWRKFFWDLEVIDLARIVQQLNRSRRHFFRSACIEDAMILKNNALNVGLCAMFV
jgi:hypothetical protein